MCGARGARSHGEGHAGAGFDVHVERQQPPIKSAHRFGFTVGSDSPPLAHRLEKRSKRPSGFACEGFGRPVFRREKMVRSIEQPHQDLRRGLQRVASQDLGHGRGQNLVAAGEDQNVGPDAVAPQGPRQLAAHLGYSRFVLIRSRVIPVIDRTPEARDADEIDVGGRKGRTHARRLDTQLGQLGLQPFHGGMMMPASRMDGRVDDQRSHARATSLRHAGRQYSMASRSRIVVRHRKSNSDAS